MIYQDARNMRMDLIVKVVSANILLPMVFALMIVSVSVNLGIPIDKYNTNNFTVYLQSAIKPDSLLMQVQQ